MVRKFCAFDAGNRPCSREMTEDTSSALLGVRVWVCPLGHKSYNSEETGLRILSFRRARTDRFWHFSRDCEQWPTRDFVESEVDISDVCLECAGCGRYL